MKKSVITLLHIGYWIVYLFLLLVILLCLTLGTNLKTHPALTNVRFDIFFSTFAIVPAALGFYIFYSILFSKLLARKKILFFFIAAVITAVLCGIGGAFILTVLAWCKIGPGVFADGFNSAFTVTLIMSIIALLNGVVGLVMKGFISWYDDIKLKEELGKKNYETELALVKSQLDPHFLFNTIHNIDVLIEKDPGSASKYLNKLSDIMRFMLYETKPDRIPLEKELAYIEKYIELQKIRSANPNYVNYSVKGEQHHLLITPMLFIPFIENAFKHTESKKKDNAINIILDVGDDTITFECENDCKGSNPLQQTYNGLGNDLIKRRLALLYPGKHTLEINNIKDKYKVKLTLDYK